MNEFTREKLQQDSRDSLYEKKLMDQGLRPCQANGCSNWIYEEELLKGDDGKLRCKDCACAECGNALNEVVKEFARCSNSNCQATYQWYNNQWVFIGYADEAPIMGNAI